MSDERRGPPLSGTIEGDEPERGTWSRMGGSRIEWSEWSWEAPRWRLPILGVLLILVGGGLLLEQLVPALTLTTLILLAIGIGLTAAWLARDFAGATVPGLVILAWALARLGSELGYLPGDGWVATFVGVALLIAWLVGRTQRVARDWALWVGIALAVIGIVDVAELLPELFSLEVIVPAAVIAFGVLLIFRGRRT
jgi:hypothetical protein